MMLTRVVPRWPSADLPALRAVRLAGDVRIELFGAAFALGTIHHELQFILIQQTTGPFADYLERLGRAYPTVLWPSAVAVALHTATLIIAVLALLAPRRRALLCLLAPPFVLSNLAMPLGIASHNTLMMGAAAVLLLLGVAEAIERVSRRGWREAADAPTVTDWCGWTRTGLLWLCGLTYAFAAFHKLNPRWFSDQSPAVDFLLPFAEPLGIPRDVAAAGLRYPAPYGAFLIEAALPLLLVVRPTRLLGCLLGMLFHLPMLAQGVMDFPIVILAFYPLFMTRREARELLARCLARPSAPRAAGTFLLAVTLALVLGRAEQPASFATDSLGVDLFVLLAHRSLLYVTLLLAVHVAATLAAWLLERGTVGASARVAAEA